MTQCERIGRQVRQARLHEQNAISFSELDVYRARDEAGFADGAWALVLVALLWVLRP